MPELRPMTDYRALREPHGAARVENNEGVLGIDRMVGLHRRYRTPFASKLGTQDPGLTVPTIDVAQRVPEAL
jgi:hypothetical protein